MLANSTTYLAAPAQRSTEPPAQNLVPITQRSTEKVKTFSLGL